MEECYGCEVASGAFAAHEEDSPSEFSFGVIDEVFGYVEAVFVGSWVRVFWREPVANTYDSQVVVLGKVLEERVLRLLVLEHPARQLSDKMVGDDSDLTLPASSMNMIEYARRLARFRSKHSTRDLAT